MNVINNTYDEALVSYDKQMNLENNISNDSLDEKVNLEKIDTDEKVNLIKEDTTETNENEEVEE